MLRRLTAWRFVNLVLKQQSTCNSYCTVTAVCQKWRKRFDQHLIPEPRQSAELIVAHAMGKKMIHELLGQEDVSEEVSQWIDDMCQQRLKRKPVQYILGEWEFHDMTLSVTEPVLIPRPETEELAGFVLDQLTSTKDFSSPLILDVGCGTGAIGLFLLRSLPQSRCVSVDKSFAACDLTHENSRRHNLQDRITILQADFQHNKTNQDLQKCGKFDVIVSNPPYIPSSDMTDLMDEVKLYEDHDALHGGQDGMDLIKVLLTRAQYLLKDKGFLWLEVFISQPQKIQEFVEQNPDIGLEFVDTILDFTNRERFCKLQKRGFLYKNL